jgi:F0F1-type ATP synthase membrane subunit a
MHIVNSPLEQFEILPGSFSSLCPLHNNFSASLMIVFFFFLFFSTSLTSYKLVPTNWQALFEVLFSFFFYLSRKNERRQYITTKFNTFRITSKGNVLNINYGFTNSIFYKIFPLTFFSFMFLLFSNMGGMIPYSFTVTAHIIATASFSSILFFGMNFKEIRKQGRFFFSRFHTN